MSAETAAALGSALGSAIIVLAVVVGRMRERLARLEEWVRIRERASE